MPLHMVATWDVFSYMPPRPQILYVPIPNIMTHSSEQVLKHIHMLNSSMWLLYFACWHTVPTQQTHIAASRCMLHHACNALQTCIVHVFEYQDKPSQMRFREFKTNLPITSVQAVHTHPFTSPKCKHNTFEHMYESLHMYMCEAYSSCTSL